VTTLPAQLSFPEEKAPSILVTSNVKPGLGSSWKYGTDLQVFLSRFEMLGGGDYRAIRSNGDHSRLPSGDGVDQDMSAEIYIGEITGVDAETRIAEVMKSKRLVS
jgi:hypothetical protein